MLLNTDNGSPMPQVAQNSTPFYSFLYILYKDFCHYFLKKIERWVTSQQGYSQKQRTMLVKFSRYNHHLTQNENHFVSDYA